MQNVIFVIGTLCAVLAAQSLAQAAPPKFRHYSVRNPSPHASAASTSFSVPALCAAYNFPTGVSANGVIGILEFGGGYLQSDLDQFSALYGMPKITVNNVSIDGTTNSPGVDFGADGEVTLDIQIAAATYFYATGKMPTIYMFFSQGDFINTFSAAVKRKCDVLSVSWGGPESQFLSNTTFPIQVEAAAAAATAAGLTIFAASGDLSSTDGTSGTSVDIPAACPHVVGCGGTTKTSSTEVVWGDGNPFDGGTGGGYSAIFPVQSFQIGAPAPPSSSLGRMVPDVAGNADFNTGYIIVLNGQVQVFGGTSCVSPLYSGLFAALGKQLGFVTPLIFKAESLAFTDITIGSNGTYSAAKGPDPCTGVGVPNATFITSLFKTITPSKIVAQYSSGVLTLTGDANANSVTVSVRAGVTVLTGANGTAVTVSPSSGSNGKQVNPTTATFKTPTAYVVNLGAGDDGIAFVGVGTNSNKPKLTVVLGDGDDTIGCTQCKIGVCTIDGGAGTDELLNSFSTFTSLKESNLP